MVEIKRIADEREMWYAQRYYMSSFPEDERRETTEWIRLSYSEPEFFNNVIISDGAIAGFVSYWNFGEFVYVEHFAVDSAIRGKGIGGKVIDKLCENAKKTVVLEVEQPCDEISRKRIAFYERHGFSLCDRKYVQPPYDSSKKCIEMKLMWWGKKNIDDDFNSIVECIYNKVYNFSGKPFV